MAYKVNGLFIGKLTPTYTLAGCIQIFENVWPNPEETIAQIESECANPKSGLYWTQAETIGAGAYQNIRTNKLLPLTHLAEVSNNAVAQHVNNQFYKLLLAGILSYSETYGINEMFYHEHYNILKYSDHQGYKVHYDGGTGTGRAISCICYLNSNFEGGEIEFVNFGIKIKPQTGMMIMFPSNFAYAHVAHPVTSGTKYNLVTWIKDREM